VPLNWSVCVNVVCVYVCVCVCVAFSVYGENKPVMYMYVFLCIREFALVAAMLMERLLNVLVSLMSFTFKNHEGLLWNPFSQGCGEGGGVLLLLLLLFVCDY